MRVEPACEKNQGWCRPARGGSSHTNNSTVGSRRPRRCPIFLPAFPGQSGGGHYSGVPVPVISENTNVTFARLRDQGLEIAVAVRVDFAAKADLLNLRG